MELPHPICKRGRPREFCPEAALDAALGVFWLHGYEGTSLTDLTEAMGINRPSLYAAFGNKEQLFRRAMDRYADRVGPPFVAALAEPTARSAVERLLRGAADRLTAVPGGPGGCFLVVSALSGGPASQAVREEACRRRAEWVPALAARLEQAVAAGDLPAGAAVADLAAYVVTVLHGLGVQAAGGAARDVLHRVVDVALRAWPGARDHVASGVTPDVPGAADAATPGKHAPASVDAVRA